MKHLESYKLFESAGRQVVTFDFDGVMHTGVYPGTIHPYPDPKMWTPNEPMIDLLRKESEQYDIYIVSARSGDRWIWKFVDDHELPVVGVITTDDHPKLPHLKRLKSIRHYDDNPSMKAELAGSGIEFVFVQDGMVTEKQLSRTIRHIKKNEFAILTAWRSALGTRENMRRMKALERDLSLRHLGFIDMRGVGQEEDGPSVEKSVMVINHDGRDGFFQSMLALADKYDQDFMLHGKDGKTNLVDRSGKTVQTFSGAERGESAYFSALDKDRKFHLTERKNENQP